MAGESSKDDGAEPSDTASPEALEGEKSATNISAAESNLTRPQWAAIKQITEKVYTYRTKDGHDPSKIFQRKVNKRVIPDYYDVIKEPVALSTMKFKILHKSYTNFNQYVRDAALISHNAQMYNRPEAPAYHDALIVKDLFQQEFKRLVDESVVTSQIAEYPDLGDLPPVEDLLAPTADEEVEEGEEGGEEGEEEEDDEEEEGEEEGEDDDEDDESEEEGGKRRRRRGRRSNASILKREGTGKAERGKGDDSRKRRGRPPKVETPMEARIKNILKGVRKIRHPKGHTMSISFDKLPDKAELPDYYSEIKEPIAIEQIKRKAKRKKYQSVDHLLRDLDLMFNNCKSYNMEDSQVYEDAVSLQMEAHKLANAEKSKPDEEYALEEGRLPLPNGIMHNGELWKIGDWVHIQNPNDVTKPLVAQIYRTWQDGEGEKWVNACWYYRPEQTVHQYEKHFYTQEVVKTGQYRDHRIDEIVDRCFVMFVTRYSRGRPRGLGAGKEVYVCESRYNEEKHKMNKIKTWASCLPDEVRDKDYEMDLFDQVRRVRKAPSPILHLLKDDAKEADAKPRWGVDNAPPVVGAVFRGPRDENQSPPPERSPSLPPQAPQQPKSKPTMVSSYNTIDSRDNDSRPTVNNSSRLNHAIPYTSSQFPQYSQSSASPALNHQSHQHPQYSSSHPNQASDHYGTAQNRYATPQRAQAIEPAVSRPDEVFRLPENANLAIPEEIRKEFHQDEQGRILFFTAPPVDTLPPVKPGSAVAHSAKFLAARLRAQSAAKKEGKAAALSADEAGASPGAVTKRPKRHASDSGLVERICATRDEALDLLVKQMQNSTNRIYQDLYGVHWEEGREHDGKLLETRQAEAEQQRDELEAKRQRRDSSKRMTLTPISLFKDDWDPRY